ncbi:MAG: MlaD family protein [Melioribacteraceae bacterium]|nr:MlaD family protein [Melioribacteraceae bacterium]
MGSVSEISLASDTTGKIIVVMRIEEGVRNFIRLNSVASISTEGLVGKKVVSITPGTSNYERVEEGGMIESVDPVNIQEIISESKGVIANLRIMTKDFAEITTKVNEGQGTVGKIFNDDELYYAAVDLTTSADISLETMTARVSDISNYIVELGEGINKVMSDVDTTIVNIKELTTKINKGEGALGALLADESVYDSVKTVISNLVATFRECKFRCIKVCRKHGSA